MRHLNEKKNLSVEEKFSLLLRFSLSLQQKCSDGGGEEDDDNGGGGLMKEPSLLQHHLEI